METLTELTLAVKFFRIKEATKTGLLISVTSQDLWAWRTVFPQAQSQGRNPSYFSGRAERSLGESKAEGKLHVMWAADTHVSPFSVPSLFHRLAISDLVPLRSKQSFVIYKMTGIEYIFSSSFGCHHLLPERTDYFTWLHLLKFQLLPARRTRVFYTSVCSYSIVYWPGTRHMLPGLQRWLSC